LRVHFSLAIPEESATYADFSSERIVIPAQAGFQFKLLSEALNIKSVVSFGRLFKLDSGLRRNDDSLRNSIDD